MYAFIVHIVHVIIYFLSAQYCIQIDMTLKNPNNNQAINVSVNLVSSSTIPSVRQTIANAKQQQQQNTHLVGQTMIRLVHI